MHLHIWHLGEGVPSCMAELLTRIARHDLDSPRHAPVPEIPAPHARLPDWSPAPTGPCLDAGSDSASGTRRPCHERNGAWCVPCPCLRAIARACARGWKRSLDSPDSIVTTIIVSLHMVVCAVHNTGGQDKAEGEGQGKCNFAACRECELLGILLTDCRVSPLLKLPIYAYYICKSEQLPKPPKRDQRHKKIVASISPLIQGKRIRITA